MYVRYPRPTLWWAFACDVHVEWLHAPRRLLDRDRAELDRRREQKALALAGRPYARTEPLATGRAAKQRLARAVAQTRGGHRSRARQARATAKATGTRRRAPGGGHPAAGTVARPVQLTRVPRVECSDAGDGAVPQIVVPRRLRG